MDETNGELYQFAIHCDNCDQDIEILPFNPVGFKHGIIFLVSERDGYVGITCPNEDCLQTILKKETRERIQEIKNWLFAIAEYGPGYEKPLLRYHSFPFGYDSGGYEFSGPIHGYFKGLNELEKSMIEVEVLDRFIENPKAIYDVYFSYFFEDLAIDPAMHVLWLDEALIPEVADFESEKRVRIFPRYMIYDPVMEMAERFCYDHFLRREFLNRSRISESIKDQMARSEPRRAAKRPYEFQEILTACHEKIEAQPTRNDQRIHDLKPKATDYFSMAQEVVLLFEEGYGKDYLDENYFQFIHDYINAAKRVDFARPIAEKLRKKYLVNFHKQITTEFLASKRYAFYEEPPTWTIIFDGKTMRGLMGKGFKYIRYLVDHMREQIDTLDLEAIEGNPNEANLPGGKRPEFDLSEDFRREEAGQGDNDASRIDGIADKEYVASMRRRIEDLRKEIAEAERFDDIGRKEKATDELELLMEEVRKLVTPGGRLRQFGDEKDKVKDKIGRSIDRALKQLTKANKKAGDHFRDALKQIYSYSLCYDPREDIEWHLEQQDRSL